MKRKLLSIAFVFLFCSAYAQDVKKVDQKTNLTSVSSKIISAKKINPTTIEVLNENNERLTFDFYGDHIFRVFQDNTGGLIRDPQATPEAKILVENPRRMLSNLVLTDANNIISIATPEVDIKIDKTTSLLQVYNQKTKTLAFETLKPIVIKTGSVSLELKENPQEYFYGGGVQNGRFSHKGKIIDIENQNSWTDNGVASPNPYYWSTNGYGLMFYTFKKGRYDFGATEKGTVRLRHDTGYLDLFVMVNTGASSLLNDFYQLTGNPVLLPKFGFYEGHLNAYNRDYWKLDSTGILFEDGKRYKESQKDDGGIKESLNGEKNNYRFSARGVIDRYKAHDMPLGWILPNDGYGAGYGQTETLDGNIQNLKAFGDYARKNGVQIGLWTQSDLHPKPEVSALLQRDIVKEVRDAGVRLLKTDVAWVGAGYSFGLNGVADVAHIIPYYGNNARPFTISLDGWAGTQRYATIWSGDQTGGTWEYIRFHIPTYIGSGLSGQPNITSDMDGIFGGKDKVINARDFEWKTFTPMQLNMDGWGSNEKYPHALGEPTASINRTYLKLKSALIPYSYSVAKQAVNGLPIMRAMFLDDPNDYTHSKSTQYQYMYGPSFLVAPIFKETQADANGNDIRNGIYLPKGIWIDYFTGTKYEGNRIINHFDAPIWKLPVFVKNGAIIPMANANNNVSQINKNLRIYEVYPAGKSSFTEYDDDGNTEAYKYAKGTSTVIESSVVNQTATIIVQLTKGNFDGFVKNKATEFKVNVSKKPQTVVAKVGNKIVKLKAVFSKQDFLNTANAYFYNAAPNLNEFATKGSDFEKVKMIKNPQVWVKLASNDVTLNTTKLEITGFEFTTPNVDLAKTGALSGLINVKLNDKATNAFVLSPTWNKVANADYYEIMFNGMNYSNIKDTTFILDDLNPETNYALKVRAVNKSGVSNWSTLQAQTKANPLQFAIQGIEATTTAKIQGGSGIKNLFDFDEASTWHTIWGANSVPLDIVMDLKSTNQLDKFKYMPRPDGGNGTLLQGTVYYSESKENWTMAGKFEWKGTGEVKTFNFDDKPSARYIKISVTDGAGGFGSGNQLYVFKVPGSASYIPGDINIDGFIDGNDFTSYINYTGLIKGDGDFDGYISKGDINKNNVIDVYDISVVATQLNGGADGYDVPKVEGKVELSTAKETYKQGETIEITVKGKDLKSVNGLGFALPYNQQDYEFIGVQTVNVKTMENLTNDRLHTNGKKVLYPTFVNVGDKEGLSGTNDLFILKFKAKKDLTFSLKLENGLLVDKNLNTATF
ncbi:DUF5110 domain-containing protein [Pedobacter changchengzhani]|uniref:DUF5110 domain-containing protein n=1 Tax=Pedobacter changchengzhani TaxID=2529274 RepID=A0A4R5MQ97_9SPHI|nr:TIM-barrel domain-containing protein [Pedobacter changchengzhani]TDG37898.1 DUF5110 domain-containing protein [Pedobacter changchengzhani]